MAALSPPSLLLSSTIVTVLVFVFLSTAEFTTTISSLQLQSSSCSQLYQQYNITTAGNYSLDLGSIRLDGSTVPTSAFQNDPDLITVECDFSNALRLPDQDYVSLDPEQLSKLESNRHFEIQTIIHHDSEDTGLVQGYESPGSFVRNISYYTARSLRQLEQVIRSSFTCQQYIRWECRGSTFGFWYPKTQSHSWWVGRNGEEQHYWGNAEAHSNSCGCFPYCFPTTRNATCNCDANVKTQWLVDSGLLLNTRHLPVTQLRFGDTGESYEAGKYTLGPLICRTGGHHNITMGTHSAPTTILSPGHPNRYPPPFRRYEWNVLVKRGQLIELVFPEYDVVHFGAYNSVPGCRYALEVDIFVRRPNNTEEDRSWIHIESIKRDKASPPYYVTDGRETKFVLRLITCNQFGSMIQDKRGFRAEFRRSECVGCNIGLVGPQQTDCLIEQSQCAYIYSAGYPFPHYLYEGSTASTTASFPDHPGQRGHGAVVSHEWNLFTRSQHLIQIEFNDFDIISSPGQHYCDADLLTINEFRANDSRLLRKVDYCNINRFNIGKFLSGSNHTRLLLKTVTRKVGNSRGIHATIRSMPTTRSMVKWVNNAAEGKPTDQSSTRTSHEASFAVDGNLEQNNPAKCSSTNYEREPWWRVNLQKRHRIYGVQIYSLVRKQEQRVSVENLFGERSQYELNLPTRISPVDVQWPAGNYALPMPVSGCPTGRGPNDSDWLTGMRYHAVQHDKPYDDKTQYWSDGIMLKGGATNLGIEQHFCVHPASSVGGDSVNSTGSNNRSSILNDQYGGASSNADSLSSASSINWMPGKYCIFQYGENCPDGFHSGSLTWFDKSNDTNVSKSDMVNFVYGKTPKGHYTSHNTTISFCCREDGNPENPIRLPKTRPFYLFQYGQICQEVEGMSEVEHFFHYEEEVVLSGSSVDFIFTTGQQLKFQDPHPRIDVTLFDRGLTLHYCYYDIADQLKGFQVLVDTTPDTFGYGRSYDEQTGIARPVNKPFLSAVECASYSVTGVEFEQITLNCTQPIEGQYVIISMGQRQDALQLCEVRVFGEESCGRPLGMATEEILDSAITASSFDQSHGLLYHPYNVRLNSPKAWCAHGSDSDKHIQIDLRLQNSNIVLDSRPLLEGNDSTNWNNVNYVTIVGLAMQGMQMTFKSYFVTQFQLLFSNDSMHWIYEEEPIGKQKVYKCVQCDAQHIDGNEIVMYNLLKPIVTRFIRVKIVNFRVGPCMRLELMGCRGDKKNFCSRTLTASTPGVISSPNYPFYYAQYKSCVWHIKPSNESGHIELDFIVLDLAPAEKSGGKCHDQLLIFHSTQQSPISIEAGGGGSLFKSYSSFRQQHYPKKIISNGAVTLNLRTCFRFLMSRYQGFLLRFRETDCPGCGIGDSRCSRIHNCTSLCGRILSINYPLNYVNNHRCQWLIRAPPGYYFNVTIEDFDIADTVAGTNFAGSSNVGNGGSNNNGPNSGRRQRRASGRSGDGGKHRSGCLFDHLSFTDTSNGVLLGRFCNSHKPPKYILSNWNELLIEFSTDSSVTSRGFRLKYKAQRYQLLPEARPLLVAPSSSACPYGWLYFRGYCYSAFVENESLQWYQAEEKCAQKVKGRDGHLVSITDHLEINVVHYWIIEQWKLSPHQSIYIGLIDTNREGFYNWSDGNPMSYTDWFRSSSVPSSSSSSSSSSTPTTSMSSSSFSFSSVWSSFVSSKNWTLGPNIAKESGLPDSTEPIPPSSQTDQYSQTGQFSSNFNQQSQPDGGAFEDCTVINFHSIHSTANWHDIPCSLGKKVMSSLKLTTSDSLAQLGNWSLGGGTSSSSSSRRINNDGLIRSYICKMDSNSSLHQHSPRKTLFTRVINDNEKQAVKSAINSNRYFVCNNYEVISNLFRCDGTANCRDGSDETEQCPFNDNCLESQYQCANGHCIAIGKYCDFVDDCGDGSDEISCVRRQCKKMSEFKCNNGQCIPLSKRCDLLSDCRDQSDEGATCSGGKCNLNSTFQCYYGNCIPLYALCDRHRDCPGKFYEDEHESVCSVGSSFLLEDLYGPTSSLGPNERWSSTVVATPHSKLSSESGSSSSGSNPSTPSHLTRRNVAQLGNRPLKVDSNWINRKNRRRTCQDVLLNRDSAAIPPDGYYELQPSWQLKLTLNVYCRFLNGTHAMTIVNHDTEDRLYVRSSVDGPGSYVRSLTYESSINLIVSLIDHSQFCRQLLNYECSGSGFYFNTTKPNSWWISRTGARQYNWGGQTPDACACYPNCSSSGLRCNCDTGLRFNWTRDYGFVEDRAKLPIRQIAFGDVYRIGQLGYVQVGPVECVGNRISSDHTTTTSKQQQQQSKTNEVGHKSLAQFGQFQCHSGQMIEARHVCIYEFDQLGYQIGCRDVSHLRNCARLECPPDYVKCPDSYCIPHRYICNGKWDCVGGSDEIGCARYSCPGRYKCANESSCIWLHQLCDGLRHCPLGDDEWFCELTCPETCICTGLFVNCGHSNFTTLLQPSVLNKIPNETRKLDLSGNNLGPDLAVIDFAPFANLGELILQRNHIEVICSRKFIHLTNLYKLDLRFNQIKVIEAGAFAGLQQVISLMLSDNPQLAQIRSGAFVGLISLRELNISHTRLDRIERNLFLQMSSLKKLTLVNNRIETVEKGAFNDLLSLVSLDLRGNPMQHFPKDMFNMLKSLRYLYTDSFKFCCLVSGIVPFERCQPAQDEISDCEDLMSNTVQRLILWILGIVAFFGNLLVVIWRFKTRTHTNRVSSTLILSLGCSDFLMGIYLLIIASVDEFYRGRYIENSDYWKNSMLCKLCGFLSTISSEMSVATLVFITIDRLISISFSFSQHRYTLKFTYRLLLITWIIMLFVSGLPLLPLSYFNGQFYSRSGVCLALHITTRQSPGWEYSVAIFLFLNLVAFLIILGCYCYMYKTISVSAKKMKKMVAKQARETRIGRQMALIVISNFLCWFPVIMMGFLALAGITIPGAAYSWTAVVVLPLNSATNPLIYTLLQFIPNVLNSGGSNGQKRGNSGGRSLIGTNSRTMAQYQQQRQQQQNMKQNLKSTTMMMDSRIQGQFAETSFIGSNVDYNNRCSDNRASTFMPLLRPPPGYQTLAEFIRFKDRLTTRDLLQICHSLSCNLKEIHECGYALGIINLDNVFVTESPIWLESGGNKTTAPLEGDQLLASSAQPEVEDQPQTNNNNLGGVNTTTTTSALVELNGEGERVIRPKPSGYRSLQTYIPGVNAYRVNPNNDEADDYAVDMEEFGLMVKRMLQLYHARQLRASTNSVVNNQTQNQNNQPQVNENPISNPEVATTTITASSTAI